MACTSQIPVTSMTSTATLSSPTPEPNTATAVPGVTATAKTPIGTKTPDAPLAFVVEADARVEEAKPDQNFGDGTTLRTDGGQDPDVESFLLFHVTGVAETVQRALLRLYVTNNGSGNGPAVYASDPGWSEKEITWNTRPARTSEAVEDKGEMPTETWVEYDVTSLVTGNGTFSFLLATDSNDSTVFASRQGSQPPELVLTFGSEAPTPSTATSVPPEEGAVFVGAGDISECDNDNDEATARLLDAIPGTVYTTGDNVYNSGTRKQFAECYDPTWGRHKDRTMPIPGNHDYRTSDASGYFQYFNNIDAYYAYDLGDWRVYALNSEIDISEASPQILWLRADLLANPRQCVLAYWHKPRWSSGDHHGSDPEMQTLWQILYEAGAEVVLNGHEHNYERFAPMNASGEADPQGLREFVVGTGGKDLYPFDGGILPASEIHDDTSYGVLKLTLRPNGYDWEFIPIEGNTFTDRGSTDCH